MIKNIATYCLILIVILTLGCSKVDSPSALVEEVDAFKNITVLGPFNITLQEDSVFSITIEGHPKAITHVEYTVSDSTLTLDDLRGFKFIHPDRKINLLIKSPPLSFIKLNAGCVLRSNNPITSNHIGIIAEAKGVDIDLQLNCNTFYHWGNGGCGGLMKLTGNTNELKIWSNDILSINTESVTTKYALIENNSITDFRATVTEKLEYKITNRGNITIQGNPDDVVNLGVTGKGEIRFE